MTLLKELLESAGVTLVANKGSKDAASFTVKLKGKSIGTVWQAEEDGKWEAEYDATGASWECDSKQDAIDMIKDQLNESVIAEEVRISDVENLRKMFSSIEDKMELVGKLIKPESVFDRKFKQCDGDIKHLASIVKLQNKLLDEFQELYQYTLSKLDTE